MQGARAGNFPQPFHIAHGREAKEALVFPVEVRCIVIAHAGIDTGSYSFPYIATWASRHDGPALLKQVMSRVQPIAHRLIAGITPEDQRSAEGPDLPADDRLAA